MKSKTTKILSMVVATSTVFAGSMPIIANADSIDAKQITINLEKKSVFLGMTQNVSVKFQNKPNSDTITLNFLCYDIPLEATLKYNQDTQAYEGEIVYNKDPEYLNVWELQSIDLNDANRTTLDKQELKNMGLNLSDYDVIQEFVIENPKEISAIDATKTNMELGASKGAVPITKLVGNDRYETAVAVSKASYTSTANKVIIVCGEKIADGVTATPLAATYDAPILLTTKNALPASTKEELKRLNPKEIIIIGKEGAISQATEKAIQQTVTSANVKRIGGADRHETSLEIAKAIDEDHSISKIYIANGYKGEVDALTIASKAGEDKEPIILSDKQSMPSKSYNWLKTQSLKTAYFIGGSDNIATNVIYQMSKITPSYSSSSEDNIYNHRISGEDRHQTNAKVIEKFYSGSEYEAVLVCKSEDETLADALSASAFAAKLKSPVMFTPKNYVSAYHTKNIESKTVSKVYQIGGGLTSAVMEKIAESMSKHNTSSDHTDSGTKKTIVIDPGHGGVGSGASYKYPAGVFGSGETILREENYTLKTSLATTDYLRKQGFNVVITRTDNSSLDLSERTAISNKVGPSLFTSIHYNASDTTGNGIEVYYMLKDKDGGVTKNAASNIMKRVLEVFNLKNRGIKTKALSSDPTKDYLYVLRNNNYPSILVECAFIDNESDIKQIYSTENTNKMGVQIGKGIEDTFK
ncbi:MAG: cell wall-binding repeat-containing protein [Clostridioides sp.]|jgi:N-acetylmuramoyl-L-alanine amidase|nr:cell wall-binding repeat-containing protein [Clostridioides sp.]